MKEEMNKLECSVGGRGYSKTYLIAKECAKQNIILRQIIHDALELLEKKDIISSYQDVRKLKEILKEADRV